MGIADIGDVILGLERHRNLRITVAGRYKPPELAAIAAFRGTTEVLRTETAKLKHAKRLQTSR